MDYNILIADFAGKNRICMTDTLYQYDYGQKLKIENVPALPQTFEAHFSNVQHGGVSITITGMDGIVDIPNTLVMTGKRIYCWIYVTEPGSGETEYQILLPVQARPMPEYYDVTDVGVFDSVVQQVGDYAATATAGATSATASAAAAATSASEAAASETAAQTAQTGAETAATNAGQSASTATTKASEAAQSASNAAQSKTAAEAAATRAEQAAASLVVDDTLSDTSTNPVQNKVITGEVTQVKSAIDALKIVDTASGSIASFSDGAAMPVESLTVSLSPIQAGSGDPSPDNIRPITGRTAVTVVRTGINVWDEEWENGYYNVNGEFVSSSNYICSKNMIPVSSGMTYYLNFPVAMTIRLYDADKNFIGSAPGTWRNETFQASTYFAGAKYFCFYNAVSGTLTTYNHNISINYPSTDHDYHPGAVQSVTIQLGQTVYGGTAEIISGQGESTMAMVDLGTLEWNKYKSSFYANLADAYLPQSTIVAANIVCSNYMVVPLISIINQSATGVALNNGSHRVNLYDPVYSENSPDEFKTAMSGVQLCYELATPQTITLDPVTLSTLKGDNNVWSDADSVSVDYVADPKLYIARLTEPDADMIADANIVNGQYFMVGNNLYLATANIASGATIVPGVNCTRTNLAAALNAINA